MLTIDVFEVYLETTQGINILYTNKYAYFFKFFKFNNLVYFGVKKCH